MKRQHRVMHSTRSIKAYAQAGWQRHAAAPTAATAVLPPRTSIIEPKQASAHSHLAQDLWISNVALVNLVEGQPIRAPIS